MVIAMRQNTGIHMNAAPQKGHPILHPRMRSSEPLEDLQA